MATTNPKPTSAVEKKKSLFPPEETIWKRYSEHHEAPLSGITSLALHGLAIGLAFLLVTYVKKNLEDKTPPKVEVGKIVYGDGGDGSGGGGGGNPNAVGKGDGGSGTNTNPPKERGGNNNIDDRTPQTRQNLTPTQQQNLRDIVPENSAVGKRLIGAPTDTLTSLAKINKGLRNALRRSVNPSAGKGGTGSGGGKDTGKDTGSGSGEGAGSGGSILNEREKRVLRWAMNFTTRNGTDYARQLRGLDAILAIPAGGDNYRVIRDLSQVPTRGRVEDVSNINRIYWIDDRPQSVRSLSTALQIRPEPEFFVAFFPLSLENKLLRIEMDFARKKYGNNIQEDDIHATRFRVFPVGGTKYDVDVNSVELKR